MSRKKTEISLEQALTELNQLVETMERQTLPLDEALQQFEHGIQLVRHCQNTLATAEQKVKILVNKENQNVLENFEQPE
jgi:exodeoxyribonuclease VII small subunit